MSQTMIVKTSGGLVRSMSSDEYDALRERAIENAVPISRQLEAEEAERK